MKKSMFQIMFATCVVLGLSIATAATVPLSEQESKALPQESAVNGIVSIPLVAHHVQRNRRLKQGDPTTTEQDRPHFYPRFYLQDLLEQQQNGTIDRDLGVTVQAEQVAALFQGYGTHYADLWCGTPPQRQTVIVDTGSGVTAFPCSGCKDCGVPDYHIDKLFSEGASSTFHALECNECLRGHCERGKCKLGQSYQEGSSWYAYEAQDNCYVGGLHDKGVTEDDKGTSDLDPFHAPAFSFPLKFGCQNKITGLFKTQLADGIMGMDIAKAAFWEQMYNAGKIKKKAFSLCFSRSPTAAREGTGAGAMSLGGADDRLHSSEMLYSKADNNVGFYVVHVRKAYLRKGGSGDSARNANGAEVWNIGASESVLNKGNVIIDSGTTDTYFHKQFGSYFHDTYKRMTGSDLPRKAVKLTEKQLNAMPTILLQFKGDQQMNKHISDATLGRSVVGMTGDMDKDNPYDVLVAIPPSHYMEYDEDKGTYQTRFYMDESRGSVLGANSMMGHDVLFDIDNNRVGWAESDCDYRSLMEKNFDGRVPLPDDKKRSEAKANDEERFRPEDEDAGIGERAPTQFCKGMGCQLTIGMAVVAAVVLVGLRLAKGSASGDEEYELTASELEMQTPPSALETAEEDSEVPPSSYRDKVESEEEEDGEFA